jgi:ATP-dependent helicase/nuclease subunit B
MVVRCPEVGGVIPVTDVPLPAEARLPMRPQPVPLSLSESLLDAIAVDLRTRLPGAANGDFSGALVLLPSTRACRTLGQLIFEHAGHDAILLPRILTPAQLAIEAGIALGITEEAGTPADRSRALILTHALAAHEWLAARPESAPGLAQELVRTFDEVRLHGLADLLLLPENLEGALGRLAVRTAESETAINELERLHEAWRLYRTCVPHDHVDVLVRIAGRLERTDAAAAGWPGANLELAVAAGFTRLDPVTAAPLRAALAAARNALVFVGTADDPLSRRLAATWDPQESRGGPLAPARRAAVLLGVDPVALEAVAPAPSAAPGAALRERLDALARELPALGRPGPGGPLLLAACGEAEHESRVIADLVVRRLQESDGATARLAVAVPDRKLAARVAAQLRQAGLDVDNTHGEPLSAQPAGLLLRFLLRAALTGLRGNPLLEVLTHPYVAIEAPGGSHGLWTLRLEQMLRRHDGFQGGLAALVRRANDHDAAAAALLRRSHDGMETFVGAIGEAFEPLLALGERRAAPWGEHLAAAREVWSRLAAARPLIAASDRADIIGAARHLDELALDAHRLPVVPLSTFAADLNRLLVGELAPPHRDPGLGLLVTGHLEARLERFDMLVIGGLADGSLPRRPTRPVFLGGRAREALGLPGRRDSLDADSELFLRLLHGAPKVALTWPAEDGGQPVLPSSLLERLLLVHGLEANADGLRAGEPVAWRPDLRPIAELDSAQQAFQAEPVPAPLLAAARPRLRLSWSALRLWRDCPYRFLLERGFGLRRDEEVQREFGRMEYGSIVHAVLQDFLMPDSPGARALADGDRDGALAALENVAAARFGAGAAELPHRLLWLDAFRAVFEPLVDHEIGRFREWRPVGLEVSFSLPLADLHAWLRSDAAAAGDDEARALLAAVPVALPAGLRDVVLDGKIDRLDRALDGSARLAVLDYKTGAPPSGKDVERFEEMQVLLYALAVAAGAVAVPGDRGADVIVTAIAEGAYYGLKAEACGVVEKLRLAALDGDGRAQLREGAARLLNLALDAAAPDGPFPLVPRAQAGEGPALLPCGRCDFRGVCRLEEADLPAALERRVDKLVNAKEGAW